MPEFSLFFMTQKNCKKIILCQFLMFGVGEGKFTCVLIGM